MRHIAEQDGRGGEKDEGSEDVSKGEEKVKEKGGGRGRVRETPFHVLMSQLLSDADGTTTNTNR